MAKEHLVIVQKEDGSAASYPMKQWLRENPDFVPNGLDASSDTSHTLRRGLRHSGWILKEKADKVLLIKPTDKGDYDYAASIIELLPEIDDEDTELLEAEEITFGLEKDMQSALRANISQLESGLTIIDGGKEKITEVGRIDITAQDVQGNIVVIELKAGKANPDVITQIFSYMGSIAEAEKKPVRGILIAGDFHKKVIWAAKALPNLQLKKYSFQFTFSDAK
jgi:hypothetical protein